MSFYWFLSSFANSGIDSSLCFIFFPLLNLQEIEYNRLTVASILPSVDPSVLPSVDPSILPIDWPIDSSHRYVSRFLCSFIFLRFQMVKYMFVCFEYCCEMWIFRSLIFVAVNILQVAVNIVVNFWLSLFVYFCLSWYWLSLFVCFCFCDVISILWMSLFASASASVCWPFQFSVMFSEVRRRPNFFFWVDPGQTGSTHLTRDPITGPGRWPGRVLKLWLRGN